MRALVLAVILLPAIALAQIPSSISYQGRLVTAAGTPQSGIVNMQFALFDDPTAGTTVWCEKQVVALSEGYYAVLLGSGTACTPATTTALPAAFAAADRYLEVSIEGSPLTPRQKTAAVPFAYVAGSLAGGGSSFISNQTVAKQTAGYNIVGSAYISGPAPFAGSGTLDTTQASAAVVGHGTAFGTEVVVGDLLTINGQSQHVSAITDATHLTADGNWTANNNGYAYRVQKAVAQLGVYSTATPPPASALVVNDKGNVGISKTIPLFKLDVGGNLRFDKGLLGAESIYQLNSVGYSATNPFPSQGVNTDWSGLMLNQVFHPTGSYHLGMSIYTDNQAAPTYARARLSSWSDFGMTPDLELASGGKIYLNGNVGVGTASPAAPLGVSGYLHVSGSTNPTVPSQGAYFSWNATGGAGETDFINQRGGGGGGFNFYNATSAGVIGSAIATINSAGVYTASDERLKNISGEYHRGLDALRSLQPIVFRWKPETGIDSKGEIVGFSAQNVRKSIPEAVVTDAEGHLSLTDRPIVSTLVNAVRELEDQNDALKKQNSALEARLKVIEEKMAAHAGR